MAGELNPPRVRPAIRRIAIWVAPVLLFIAAWQIWDAIEAQRVERALASVLGSPTPMQVRPFGKDDGAGRYYAAAAMLALAVSFDDRLQAAPGGPIVNATTLMREALTQGKEPTSEAIQSAAKQLDRGRPVFDLMARAGALPFNGFDPGTDFNYRFSGLLNVNRLAGLEAMNLLITGRADQSASVLHDRLRSLRAFDQQNSLTQMIRTRLVQEISTDLGALAGRMTVSEARLTDLDRALSETYPADALERTIRGAALWWHQQLRSMWEGRGSQGFITLIGPLLRPVLRHHAAMRLQTASDALATARLRWPNRINAMNAIPEHRSMVPELVPFVAAWRETSQVRDLTIRMAEGIAAVRCARLVIAIERYRLARGTLPRALSDVVNPSNEEWLDPFTGKSLLYAQTDAGYVVFSVGRDLKDEGGKLAADLPRGRLPGTLPAPDVGVRVRRLPPASSRLAQP